MVTAPGELAEGVANFLIDRGAPGLQTEELNGSVRLTAHFEGDVPLPALERFCDALLELFPGAARPEVRLAPVSEAAWAENWKAHFPPLVIGKRLFVHPPWIAAIPEKRIAIEIDPGMAFGTGQHASTRGSLRLLERAMDGCSTPRVLDVGTGSGVLAIAAAKLGATDVWAIDIDLDAGQIAAANARVNHVSPTVHVGSRLEDTRGTFNIIVANLLAMQLVDLAPQLVPSITTGRHADRRRHPGGRSFLRIAGLVTSGLRPDARDQEQGWVALAFRRR